MKTMLIAVVAALSLCSAACARSFDIKPAAGFVEVKEDDSVYDYRAVAPDGVAVAVRSVRIDESTSLAFWESALMHRMRELDGYAKVGAGDVKSADGIAGREITFGHDEASKPYVYRVRIFVRANRLVMVEVGGSEENMERWKLAVDSMLASLRVG